MGDTDADRAAAFKGLAERDLYSSYRLASAILGDEAESQDAVHDAFLIAWRRWGSLRDLAKFQPWFNRILVNVCRDRLRRSARRPTTDITLLSALGRPDASQEVLERIRVEQAFAVLKPDDRIVLALRHFVDLEIEDIARLLDVPLPTAKTRLRTARARLRTALERQAADEVSR